MKHRPRIHKPILGFGWAGYTASAVLLALIIPLAAGVDLRYELLKLIQLSLGDEAMMFFVSRLAFAEFAISDPTISVITGTTVLVAARVAPYRINPAYPVLVFLLCVAWAFVTVAYFRAKPIVWLGDSILGASQIGLNFSGYLILSIIGTIFAGLLLVWISRSWIVAIGFLLALCAQYVCASWLMGTTMGNLPEPLILFKLFGRGDYSVFSLAFDIFTIGPLLLWAILERRKPAPVRACQGCAYDLAGIPEGAPCPECGRKPAPPAP